MRASLISKIRVSSAILVLTLIFTLSAAYGGEGKENTAAFVISAEGGAAGEELFLNVRLTGHVENIAGFLVHILFDTEVLEPLSIAQGPHPGGWLFSNIGHDGGPPPEYAAVVWQSAEGSPAGEFFTMVFNVNADAPIGETVVNLTVREAFCVLPEHMEVKGAETRIHITPRIPWGDLNADGFVDAADILILSRYLAGLEALPDEPLYLADMNRDGRVDVIDLVMLAKYNK